MSAAAVSVVVPVYGAEKYIAKCARSLFGQTLGEMEFIFIDDCSPDRSGEILRSVIEEFPDIKAQVRIIRHAQNQGVSRSRQDGMDAATGEYIIHCDPDDFVEANMYADMYADAKRTGADMVICGYFGADASAGSAAEELTSIELLERICGLSARKAHGGLCNKLIRAEYAKAVAFPKGISFCEDVNVLFQMLRNDMKIICTDKPFYHYNYHPGSICTTLTRDAVARDAAHIDMLLGYRTGDGGRYDRCLEAFAMFIAFKRIFRSGAYSDTEFRQSLGHLRPYVSLYRKSWIPRVCMRLAMRGKYHPALMIYKAIPFKSRM